MSFGLIFLLNSCISSTNYTSSVGGCPKVFRSGEKILMGEMTGVSPNQSYEFYEQFAERVSKSGLRPYYAVEQEMDLRVHGIKPIEAIDSSSLVILQRLGYDYYIKVNIGNTSSGTGYTSVSAAEQRELQTGYGAKEENNTKASVVFELYSTSRKQLIYTLAATTAMEAVTIPSKETENGYRGSKSINLSTTPIAVKKAFNKGVERLLQACQ